MQAGRSQEEVEGCKETNETNGPNAHDDADDDDDCWLIAANEQFRSTARGTHPSAVV